MKILTPLVLLGSLVPALALASQEGQEPAKQEPAKKRGNAVTRYFEGETERLAKETLGSWMLFDYVDPEELMSEDAASGFATFHDGFLTLLLTIDTADRRLFLANERVLVQSGAFRYRFDESGALQLANVMSVTNQTDSGDIEHEPQETAYEYFARLDENVLELRNSEGVTLSFRKVTAGDFPDSAIRKLEARRSGSDHWEVPDNPPR